MTTIILMCRNRAYRSFSIPNTNEDTVQAIIKLRYLKFIEIGTRVSDFMVFISCTRDNELNKNLKEVVKLGNLLKKQLAVLLAIILCIGAFTGCSGNTQENSSPASRVVKDELVVLLQSEPATLDPSKANNENIGNVNHFIADALFELNPDGTYSNILADNWELVDDTTLKVKLKEGIKFSDGSPLTAEDVLWNYIRASKQAVSKSQFMFLDAEKSQVIDDLNLTIKFNQPWAPFLNILASARGHIISKKAFEKMGEEAASRAPVGTGPYKLVEWVSGTHVKLTANENYWGGAPKMKNVILKFIEEPSARVIELETGAADIAFNIQGTDIERFNNIKGYHIEKGDSFRYYTLLLSMQEPLFQNKDVRYAMSYAIDKKALVSACTDDVGTPISTMGPPLVIEGMKEMEEIPYDIGKAKELMAQAGYPNGFEIDIHVEQNVLMQRLAEAIQSMWAEIGIKANVVSSPLATYDAQRKGKFQASIRDGTATEISNIWIIYESSFGSRLNGNDKWLDDKLLELKACYPDNPKRKELLDEIADYLYDIRFGYPFMVMPTVYAVSDQVEGFEFHPAAYYLNVKDWVAYTE